HILLMYKLGTRITAAVADPSNAAAIAGAEQLAGAPLSVAAALPDELAEAIQLNYPAADEMERLETEVQRRPRPRDDSDASLREYARSGEIVQLCDTMLTLAVRERASDVHIEPHETYVQVRFRVDGLLRDRIALASGILPRVISRLKLMSGMNITERRRPQ